MIRSFSSGFSVLSSALSNRILPMAMLRSISIIYPSGVFSFAVSSTQEKDVHFLSLCSIDVRHSLIIMCMSLVAFLMAPITWYLWIYTGSANANFYFAMTMVFNVAQVRRCCTRSNDGLSLGVFRRSWFLICSMLI